MLLAGKEPALHRPGEVWVSPLKVDSLYLAFRGWWKPEVAQAIQERAAWLQRAASEGWTVSKGPPVLRQWTLGGQPVEVIGRDRSCEVIVACDTAFKAYLAGSDGKDRGETPVMRVQIFSDWLEREGWWSAGERVVRWARELMEVLEVRPRRIDVAVDQWAPDFDDRWIHRVISKSGVAPFAEPEVKGSHVLEIGAGAPLAMRIRSRKVTGFTVGTRGNEGTLLRCYDKFEHLWRQRGARHVLDWWRAHGFDAEAPHVQLLRPKGWRLFRAELEAGGDRLATAGIRSWAEVTPEALEALMAWALGKGEKRLVHYERKTAAGRKLKTRVQWSYAGFARILGDGADSNERRRPPVDWWRRFWEALPDDGRKMVPVRPAVTWKAEAMAKVLQGMVVSQARNEGVTVQDVLDQLQAVAEQLQARVDGSNRGAVPLMSRSVLGNPDLFGPRVRPELEAGVESSGTEVLT